MKFHHLAAGITVCLALATSAQQFDRETAPEYLPPSQSVEAFHVPDDLRMELVLGEPDITQPLHMSFDERGRLWVVEYRQYPEPAGLKQVSHDRFWRSVYDQVPPAPPNHFKGKDRVSIHEDTDGDGTFDAHKVFVDGLNIATSAAVGGDGVWVLNPPYLLFYPDRNRDDVPDGDPEVHLSGFGLEDTHSVANSLRWGPDGWLYACQGSTVSGHVQVEPLPSDPSPVSTNVVHTLGQNIWRYHPVARRYEVFAEGGGNAFGIEIDSGGRLFSGHNGGDTRGFHYQQGAYLRKGFQKHGELSNPHAYGYFPQMENNRVERFTHTFLIYEADLLPGRYLGKLFGVEPLQGRVVLSDISSDGSTFKTEDIEHVVTSSDRWFRPVDIKLGPDGAIYLADWYDFQINHWRNYQGNMDASNGRIYRLVSASKDPIPLTSNLNALATETLIDHLDHPNRWWRETAIRLLAQRTGESTSTSLKRFAEDRAGDEALNAFWAWHQIEHDNLLNRLQETPDQQFTIWEDYLVQLSGFLGHSNDGIRRWAARFIGDPFPGSLDTRMNSEVSPPMDALPAEALIQRAETEGDVEVRVQLGATARRLPVAVGLPMIQELWAHDEDIDDPRQPLNLWWAIEAKAGRHAPEIISMLADRSQWRHPIVKETILERLMRRFASEGSPEGLLFCARLLELSPSLEHSRKLMDGFEKAFAGRSLVGLPDELIQAMARHGVGSMAVDLRRGDPAALIEALELIEDTESPSDQRAQYIQILGELREPDSLPVLLKIVREVSDGAVLQSALLALQGFADPAIGEAVALRYPVFAQTIQTSAAMLLASRVAWAEQLVEQVSRNHITAGSVPLEAVRQIKQFNRPELVKAVETLWPGAGQPTTGEMRASLQRLETALEEGFGDPYPGKRIYDQRCGVCHTLFNEGGQIGPDLTSFNRKDTSSLLLSIVNPGAEIREGYENVTVATEDGRLLSGFLVSETPDLVRLRGLDGQDMVVQRREVESIESAGRSLMPDGLLEDLNDQQVRDLFAYLRSSQPLNE